MMSVRGLLIASITCDRQTVNPIVARDFIASSAISSYNTDKYLQLLFPLPVGRWVGVGIVGISFHMIDWASVGPNIEVI